MALRIALLTAFVFPALLAPSTSHGDEGMWLPAQIRELPLADLKARGLALSPEELYSETGVSLKDACVRLNGGGSYGSASFVSKEGLLITNHHVAFGAIQSGSTTEQNFIRHGFLAKTRAEEIHAPDYSISITRLQRDVTEEVLSAVKDGMSDAERTRAINRRGAEIAREYRRNESGDAQVTEMLSGSRYYLIVYDVIRDVRLVYAPPRSIGEYGGETDNWMWPRHTGDFSFMCAYVAPDGSFAAHAKENVPYVPKKVLPVARGGLAEGDLVFIMGYPGTTLRYRDSNSVAHREKFLIPFEIEMARAEIKLLEQAAAGDEAMTIKLADRLKSLYNVLKKDEGMVEGLARTRLVERKRKEEAEFRRWLEGREDLKAECAAAMDTMDEIYRDLDTFVEKETLLRQILNGSQVMALANVMHRIAEQLGKPDEERDEPFRTENLGKLRDQVAEMGRDYDPATDATMLKVLLTRALRLPANQRVEAVDRVAEGKDRPEEAIAAFVDDLFARTHVADSERRLALLESRPATESRSEDPVFAFAAALMKEIQAVDGRYSKFAAVVTKLRPVLIRGMYEWRKSLGLYPDANTTLRFTYGTVKGYRARDAVTYHAFTTLAGVLEKDRGTEPFDVPAELKRAAEKRDFGPWADPKLGDLPCCFVADTDITGGNSGSPVLNGRGELVGVAFDGNWESMTSDFVFDPAVTRTISVDIRYVLWVTDRVGGARFLLDEMGVPAN